MADNLLSTQGSGSTIASDDIGGVHYQRMKIGLGAPDTAVDLNGDATGGLWAQGAVAHDGVDSGNPVKIGGRASSAAPAQISADGDRVNAWFSRTGTMGVHLADVAGTLLGDSVGSGLFTKSQIIGSGGNAATVASGELYTLARSYGTTAADAALVSDPVTIGARASTAVPTAVSADGDVVNLRALRTGALTVHMVDASGNAAAAATAGDVAHDAVDAGNPVKIGGKANNSLPTAVSADGDRVDAWMNRRGALGTFLSASDGSAVALVSTATIDALTGPSSGPVLYTAAFPWAFNGTNYDRLRTEAGTTGFLGVGGSVAHDGVDAGNPVKIGGKANAFAPTNVSASGDRVDAWFGLSGALVASPFVDRATLGDGISNTQAVGQFTTLNGAAFNHIATAGIAFNGTGWDRIRTIQSLDAAPNVDTGVLAVGAGPGYDRKTNPTGVAATSTANAVTVVVDGASTVSFHVTTIGTTPGSMIIETTGDDGAWVTAGAVIKLGSTETWIEGSFVPAVNDVYTVRTTGLRQVRYRVNAVYASGTATVKVTASLEAAIVKSVEMAAAPHKTGYAPFNLSQAITTTAQTSVAINTAPGNAANATTSTQKAVVTGIQIQASGTVAMTQFTVYFGTGAFSRGTNRVIFDGEFAPSSTSKPGYSVTYPINPPIGAADEEVRMTTVGAGSFVINVWGYLITA